MSIKILLADDHAIILDGLRETLGKQPDLEIVGTAQDGAEAVKCAVCKTPDLVIMDTSMPGMNGIDATRLIREQLPATQVICLSMHAEKRFVCAALEAGATGYLLKGSPVSELITAIQAVKAGQTYISSAVAGVVVEDFKARRAEVSDTAFTVLSAREREVIQLLAEGYTTKAIAKRLHLSVKTIGSHREHLMDKLGIHSVAGLTKYAIREGLTSADEDQAL